MATVLISRQDGELGLEEWANHPEDLHLKLQQPRTSTKEQEINVFYEFVDLSICRFTTITTCMLFDLCKIQRLNNSVLNFVPNRQTWCVSRDTIGL